MSRAHAAVVAACIAAAMLPPSVVGLVIEQVADTSVWHLNVSIVIQAPFASTPAPGVFSGLSIDVFERALDMLNARPAYPRTVAHYHIAPGNAYGLALGADSTWTGALGELVQGEADVALGAFTATSAREAVVDFTSAWLPAPMALLINRPLVLPNVWGFMQPFTEPLWGILLATMFGFALVLMVIDRLSPYGYRNLGTTYEERRRLTAREALANSIHAMLGKDTPAEGQSWSTRLTYYSMFFFSMVVLANYTAGLTAFAAVKRLGVEVTGLQDIAAQRLAFCVLSNSSTTSWILDNTDPAIRRMSSHWVLANTLDECVFSLRTYTVAAVLGSQPILAAIAATPPCDFTVAGTMPAQGYFAVPVARGSPIRANLSWAFTRLVETGTVAALSDTYSAASGIGCSSAGDLGASRLTFTDLIGVYYTVAAMIVVALTLLFVESCVYRRRFTHAPFDFYRRLNLFFGYYYDEAKMIEKEHDDLTALALLAGRDATELVGVLDSNSPRLENGLGVDPRVKEGASHYISPKLHTALATARSKSSTVQVSGGGSTSAAGTPAAEDTEAKHFTFATDGRRSSGGTTASKTRTPTGLPAVALQVTPTSEQEDAAANPLALRGVVATAGRASHALRRVSALGAHASVDARRRPSAAVDPLLTRNPMGPISPLADEPATPAIVPSVSSQSGASGTDGAHRPGHAPADTFTVDISLTPLSPVEDAPKETAHAHATSVARAEHGSHGRHRSTARSAELDSVSRDALRSTGIATPALISARNALKRGDIDSTPVQTATSLRASATSDTAELDSAPGARARPKSIRKESVPLEQPRLDNDRTPAVQSERERQRELALAAIAAASSATKSARPSLWGGEPTGAVAMVDDAAALPRARSPPPPPPRRLDARGSQGASSLSSPGADAHRSSTPRATAEPRDADSATYNAVSAADRGRASRSPVETVDAGARESSRRHGRSRSKATLQRAASLSRAAVALASRSSSHRSPEPDVPAVPRSDIYGDQAASRSAHRAHSTDRRRRKEWSEEDR